MLFRGRHFYTETGQCSLQKCEWIFCDVTLREWWWLTDHWKKRTVFRVHLETINLWRRRHYISSKIQWCHVMSQNIGISNRTSQKASKLANKRCSSENDKNTIFFGLYQVVYVVRAYHCMLNCYWYNRLEFKEMWTNLTDLKAGCKSISSNLRKGVYICHVIRAVASQRTTEEFRARADSLKAAMTQQPATLKLCSLNFTCITYKNAVPTSQ